MTNSERELAEAVRDLREALGESQQTFSNRFGLALRTIARYETVKPPSGEMLNELAIVAREAAYPALEAVFVYHLIAESLCDPANATGNILRTLAVLLYVDLDNDSLLKELIVIAVNNASTRMDQLMNSEPAKAALLGLALYRLGVIDLDPTSDR